MCKQCLVKVHIGKGLNVVSCNQKACRYEASLLKETIFYNKKKELLTILKLIQLWLDDYTKYQICQQLNVTYKTISDITEIISKILNIKNMENPILIGGNEIIVEIDESKFGHRKYN